jgi:hypothetical protein
VVVPFFGTIAGSEAGAEAVAEGDFDALKRRNERLGERDVPELGREHSHVIAHRRGTIALKTYR